VHPLGKLWWNAYRETAHAQNGGDVSSSLKWNHKNRVGYKKATKDKILLNLYNIGIINPKGVIE
jgi:hypothetical protein